jgi:hypothetical protein
VLGVLESRGATYRFGAPLDLRWLQHGWSSHFQFLHEGMRVRTDFFSRPPRVPSGMLAELWREQEGKDPAFTGPAVLLRIKQTGREKDWPIVGELARLLPDVRDQLRWSRSARDLLALATKHPSLVTEVAKERPVLLAVGRGLDELRLALEQERFATMDADSLRVLTYLGATAAWEQLWPAVERATAGMPLRAAHRIVVESALRCLPTLVPGTSS